MSIWTFNRRFAAGLVALALSGCGDAGLFGGGQETAAEAQPGAIPRQVEMARGAVTLVAPAGYCVDMRSQSNWFALLARCDSLGGGADLTGAELGLISVSIARARGVQAPPSAEEMAATLGYGPAQEVQTDAGVTLFQIDTPAPKPGLQARHWRAAFVVNDMLVSLALFAPEGSLANGPDGAEALRAVAQRSQAASAPIQ